MNTGNWDRFGTWTAGNGGQLCTYIGDTKRAERHTLLIGTTCSGISMNCNTVIYPQLAVRTATRQTDGILRDGTSFLEKRLPIERNIKWMARPAIYPSADDWPSSLSLAWVEMGAATITAMMQRNSSAPCHCCPRHCRLCRRRLRLLQRRQYIIMVQFIEFSLSYSITTNCNGNRLRSLRRGGGGGGGGDCDCEGIDVEDDSAIVSTMGSSLKGASLMWKGLQSALSARLQTNLARTKGEVFKLISI